MNTLNLHIRKFQSNDFENLYKLLSDQDVMEKLELPYTKEQTEQFLDQCCLSENPLVYAVENQKAQFIGYVIYHPYDADSYEIGWVLHKSCWGQGYASELTECLVEYAKGKTRKLIIECVPSQIATAKIAINHHFSFVENRDGLDVYILYLDDKFS